MESNSMAYRIRPTRNAAKEVRKAALQRIDKAIQALTVEADERAEGCIRRASASRNCEPCCGWYASRSVHVSSSTTGGCATWAALAESRDAAAMLESWDALARANQPLFVSDAFRQIRLQRSSAPRRMARCTRISTRSWPKCWVSCVR